MEIEECPVKSCFNQNPSSKYHVAIFGAYDLYSLGDTMFPVLTEKELKIRLGNSVVCDFYSPHSLEKPYNNLPPILSIDVLPKKHSEKPYDAIVIGGGEFIHFAEIDYLSPDGVQKKYEQAELWEKPQKIADGLKIPVIWNCVGVSYDITEPSQLVRIWSVAGKLHYLSVRDLYSKIRLESLCGISNVKQVGDMLWLFNRHYTKEFLERQRKEISTTNDFLNSDYIVLQYGTSYKYEELAKKVLAVSEKYKLNVVLLTVNYCHEDDAILKKIKALCPSFYTLDKILQPVEIMSVIAGAKFFMGTSLHGNIVAMSYGVPNLCLDMYPSFVSKMDGLFEMMEKFDLLINDFSDLESKFDSVYSSYKKDYFQTKISRIQADLNKHFDNISDVIRKVNSFPVSLSGKQNSSVCPLLEREHEKYSATVKRLESMSEKLSTELSNKTGHIEQLLERERNLKNELNGKNDELSRTLNSLSWKITAPCRAATKLLGRLYPESIIRVSKTTMRILRNYGFAELVKETKDYFSHPLDITYRPKLVQVSSYEHRELPNFSAPLVSIVIPVFNQFDYTYKCILSILNTVKDLPYEIIVGDDMSTDETKRISEYFPNIKVSINENDHGFLMNCKRAAKLARGKYILFLNNDTQVQENWLSSLVSLIESDEKIGMVGSKLVYPDGVLQEAGGIIWNDASGWNYGKGQNPELPEYNYVKEVDYLSGASIMIRSSLWNEIGGFDERYKPAYFEDSDLAFEVRKHGFKVMYQPKSVVVHFEGVSNGKVLSSGLKKYQEVNKKKFWEKWRDVLNRDHFENGKNVFSARDRSRNKKTILMIDHYVPAFDKDAGSKTTFQYIKMFIEKGYAVKFIGDNYAFYEMESYVTALLQLGVEVLYGSWYQKNIFNWIRENKDNINIAFLERPHIAGKYIDFIKNNTNIKIIYYGHDLHFLRMQREAELNNDRKMKRESDFWKKKELSIMKKSDVVYYPSVIEKRLIKEIAPDVNVRAIHAYLFDSVDSPKSYKTDSRIGILFVGGFGHDPNIDAVKWFVSDIFPKIRDRIHNIEFFIVGSNAPDEIKKLNGNGIVFKGFVTEKELKELYERCRIVVVPLRYGAGVKGKVIEALHNGVPVVTTPVGAEGIDGIDSIAKICDSENDFANAVIDLYRNGTLLEAMSKKSIDFIKENFSIEAAWNVIKGDF